MGIIKAVTTAISGSLADQWLEAVSYTHLDVYKRQHRRCAPWIWAWNTPPTALEIPLSI